MKTNELTGAALDWAVAKCEGGTIRTEHGVFLNQGDGYDYYTPSTNWSQGGPIIEREGIATRENGDSDDWYACKRWDNHGKFGATPLIAAMRCYVASKLGDDINIPEELL
jgi:hypothetical protein